VAVINPPITTIASGFCVSDPIPLDIAAGNNPIAAISAVITTGLILEATPASIAKSIGFFSFIFFLNTDTSITPFCTQIPNNAIKPTPAEIPNIVPVV
jgi:hypothetical protein